MAIVELAERKGRALSLLTALTYDLDPLISWRAFEAVGLAATPWIIPCLENPNPQTRGLAAWCLGQFKQVSICPLVCPRVSDLLNTLLHIHRFPIIMTL